MLPRDPQPTRRSVRVWILALAGLAAAAVSNAPLEAAPAADVLAVSADTEPCLSVRERPSRRGRIVDCLEAGTRVTLTGTRGGWSRVESEDGVVGWVDGASLVAPETVAPAAPAPEAPREPAAQAPPAAQPAPAPEQAPTAEPAPAAPMSLVRIVVATDSGTPTAASAGRPAPEAAAEAAAERDRLAERARLAEEGAARLEAELATARAELATARAELATARAELAELVTTRADLVTTRAELAELATAREVEAGGETEDSALAAQVEELTRERDDLVRRLAQAEARMLFVLSDLERTRAELMQLKGVPAALVQPESEPQPVAQPEPEPEPPASAGPQAPPPPATPAFVSIDEVVGTVRAWAQAWADQRADDYLAFYSSSFTPPGGESREAWAARRRERVRAPRSIDVTLDRINPIVSGNRARVMFVQIYTSDTFSDTVNKTLVLERVAPGTWQIVEERVE